jgi:aminoglycoside 2''-phosphotransferase
MVKGLDETMPDWRQIERENAGLAIRAVTFLGEGWTSRAYLVNDELVFRFPKRAEEWNELQREIRFLSFAADRLPLAVPRYVQALPGSSAATHGYAAYRYVHGSALQIRGLTPRGQEAAAEAIAGFMKALHGLEPPDEIADLLPRDELNELATSFLQAAEREILPGLEPPQAARLRRELEAVLREPESFTFLPAVLHADLGPEHVLVKDGSISGVIDFGDVSWGDRDYDLMYLFLGAGGAFFEQVARRYGHPDLGSLRRRVRYYALLDQLDTILYHDGRALEGQVIAAWRRLGQMLHGQEPDT